MGRNLRDTQIRIKMMIENYFENLKKDVDVIYDLASEARAKKIDPKDEVEIPLAMSLAEKVEGLVSTVYPQLLNSGVSTRILELEKEYGKLDVAVSFKIAEEVAKQKFCKFDDLVQAIEAGIRVGFAYNTLSVVSSPIEGFTKLKIGKTRGGKEYFIPYFSGPIRSAGTTASCVVLMLIDYLRELFGYEKYDPSEEEVKRYITENYDYHERVTNLQYLPTKEEAEFLAKNLPIQIDGEPTEKKEVSNYKNLERVETNFIRGGMCLIFSEGLAQKAKKGFRLLKGVKDKGFKCSGFDFLEKYLELQKKRESGKGDSSPVYIKDLVAGRPVFGHPSRSGAFRFRYGRGRNSGFSAASIHPASMAITDDFIAIGTQLKIEKPTKGCAVSSCDSIEGPIVKLINGSVKKINSIEEAKRVYKDVEEILYLGDILFPFSDLMNRNYDLIKPGYVEEWWELDLFEKDPSLKGKINGFKIGFSEAVELSKKYSIPLNPRFTYFWTQITLEFFLELVRWINHAKIDSKIIFPFEKSRKNDFEKAKRALELLGVPHEVSIENVVVDEENSRYLLFNLGIDLNSLKENAVKIDISLINQNESVLENVNSFSSVEIKDKAGDFIGSRMGRPEKAKVRKLVGSPNVLFPVGNEGGRMRSVNAALEEGKVRSTFPLFYCKKCEKDTIYPFCEICRLKSSKKYYCRECKEKKLERCEEHEVSETLTFNLDINEYFEKAISNLGFSSNDVPELIKGVRGMSSDSKVPENLAKGILRAKYDLQVNKDGTIRYDATELPLIAFKPSEISVSVEKLRELGYKRDIYGNELKDENQILELMPHDVLLPSCPNSPDERADEIFIKIGNFVDDELSKIYGLKKFHNFKSREDLIGELGVCMAPHNCAGVICRIIGFSKTQGLMASPYMHAAIRRDCDGDEAALMLLTDVLLNFSRDFLPGHRGGTQDAPLVLNAKIDAGEVDDQILDLEVVGNEGYPLELYRLAEERKHSSEVRSIKTIKSILAEGKNPFINIGFTHHTSNFNQGILCSSYKLLATMQEKVQHQMELVEKIRAVDTSDTARLIIERHFIRDMRGNLRKFSMQEFRCVGCNEILRRPPLNGVCPVCKGKLIFTIHEGGIKKYLEPALELAERYELSEYIKQSLELTRRYIDSVFGKEVEIQESINRWF